MKKLILLFFVLLTYVSGAWATVLNVTPADGTYVTSSGNYVNSISFATTPVLTVGASANNMDKRQTGSYLLWHSGSSGSSTYTFSIADGYVITEFSVTGEANTSVQTLTSGNSSHEFAVGTSSVFTVTGLSSSTASFVQTGANASGLKITGISVTVVKATDEQQSAYDKVLGWVSTIQGAEGLVTDAANYTSNAKSSAEGTYPALLDGDYSTYFHGAYGSEGPDEDQYLQATLPSAVDAIYFYFKKRSQNNNNRPTSITISGSNDGSSFTDITTINSGLPTDGSVIDYTSSKISLGASYQYIRFTVTATNNGATNSKGHVFFTFSEFYILPSNSHVDGAISTLKTLPYAWELTSDNISDINALDLTIRSATLAPAKANILTQYAIPDGKADTQGYPTTAAWTTFESAINAITIEDDFDATRDAAIAALLESANLASGLYRIKNYSTNHYLYQDEPEGIVTYATTSEPTGNHGYWRITDNGDGTYAILDLYNHQLTKGNQSSGWANVQSGSRGTVTTITRNYTDANYKTSGDLASFYLAGAHINTGYNTGSKVYVTTWTTGGLGSNPNHWLFEPVEGLTAYTITITGAPETITMGDGTVLPNGTFTVYLTGESQISAPEITGYEVSKNVVGTTATITYTVTDYQALIEAYFDTDKQQNFINAGRIGYMQNSGDDFTNLSNLILSFMNPSHEATESDYNNLVTYYEACAANVVYPTTGKYYLVKNNYNGKYMRVTAGATRGAVLADLTAAQAAKDASAHIYFKEIDSKLYMMSQNQYFNWVYSNSNDYLGYVVASKDKYVHFANPAVGVISFSIAYGNGEGGYAGYLGTGYYALKATDSEIVAGSTSDENSNLAQWTFEEVSTMSVDLHSDGAGSPTYYATLCLPFDVTISGADAYTLSESGNWLVPTAVDDNEVPAGTPVLLKGTSGNTATATFNTGSAFNSGSPLESDLTGTYFAKTIDGASDYVLGIDGGEVGFYHWNSNDLGANRAYVMGDGSSVKGFVLSWDDETGIKNLNVNDNLNKVVYDLSGRRIQKPTKGLYIVNGKKVMVK